MTDTDHDIEACRMHESDSTGNTNLCCCYITDAKDHFEDPCYVPVKECCRDRGIMGTESQ
ncbi:hypothetical protein D3OALGA1CA_2236 [Olavius algarvensis associated proteobacterium Delta 3]|nr:hypothetical protein D3OALGA1CA_2236 [Olavius algarvensis associated proteobacterium Delta 3]CAB5165818.1 hypothetical protein D3OALGB2SA_5747 [Olavius algarvensis associated proteobacterium Delta 3]